MSDAGSQASTDAIYTERNQAVAMLAKLAQRLGYPVTVSFDQDPAWPVVYITLPNAGQVSWHIPAAEFEAFFPHMRQSTSDFVWDGHDNSTKARRLVDEAHHLDWW